MNPINEGLEDWNGGIMEIWNYWHNHDQTEDHIKDWNLCNSQNHEKITVLFPDAAFSAAGLQWIKIIIRPKKKPHASGHQWATKK